MTKEQLEIYNNLRNKSKLNGKKAVFISFSKLDKFNKCPLSYRIEYIDKVKVEFKDNIHSSLGVLTHDLMDWGILGDMSKEEIVNTFDEKVEKIYKKYGIENEQPVVVSLRDFFKRSDFIEKYRGKNVKFEVPVYYKLKSSTDKIDYYIVGFIDMVIENEDGTVDILDFKISNKSGYTGKKLQSALMQIYSYAYMYEYMYRKKINRLGYHFLKYCNLSFVDIKGKKRKSSKVERKDILRELSEKCGVKDVDVQDCLVYFEYNKENRLSYMKTFVDLFNKVNTMQYDDFTSDNRDCGYCERFCPFRNHEKCTLSNEQQNNKQEDILSGIFRVMMKNTYNYDDLGE